MQDQCYQRQLDFDGLKEDLINRLLTWQQTAAGATAADQARGAAVAAAAAQHAMPQPQVIKWPPVGTATQAQPEDNTNNSQNVNNKSTKAMPPSHISPQQQPHSHHSPEVGSSSSNATPGAVASEPVVEQPGLAGLLQRLQLQPSNVAVLASARKELESEGRKISDLDSDDLANLAADISRHSSPASLAILAKACYSREIQDPAVAAAVALAVAQQASSLGPHDLHGVLQLMSEHRYESAMQLYWLSSMHLLECFLRFKPSSFTSVF